MSPYMPFVSVEGIVPLRAAPDPQSERLTDVLFGEGFHATSEEEGLLFGTTASDGVEGYVPRASLAPGSIAATHRLRRTFVHVYRAPGLSQVGGAILPLNACVELTGRAETMRFPLGESNSSVLQLRDGSWVPENAVSPIGCFEEDVRTIAEWFVGAVYLPGGKTWLGCDGPGFLQTVLAACGFRIPRLLSEQLQFFERLNGSPRAIDVPASAIYCEASCGFCFDNGEVIAASRKRLQVIRTSREQFLRDEPTSGKPHTEFLIPEAARISYAR